MFNKNGILVRRSSICGALDKESEVVYTKFGKSPKTINFIVFSMCGR